MLATVMLATLSVMTMISLAPMAGAAEGDAPAESPAAAEVAGPEGDGEADEDGEDARPFTEVIEDFEAIDGLFTFYRDDETNQVYMEIKPEQLGVIYLCDVAREAGDGYFYDSGTMALNFPFALERVGKKIRFVHRNVYYRADPDAPIAGAVRRGLTDSLVGSAELASVPHPDTGSYLVDPTSFFVQDILGVGARLEESGYGFDGDESYFGTIKSFPRNSEIQTVAHFTSSKPRPTNMAIPDSRSMQHRYRFSLVAIPESDYRPRMADDRVGHFLTMFQDYSNLEQETAFTWLINRWNLEKANPDAELSPPKEPIVFWLENTIPLEYRDAVREGTLLWNDAFERIGFENAVVVKQQPNDADWDPADVRYNVIQWIVIPDGTYAVGPSFANPFTGELYAADIRVGADYVRYFFEVYEEYVNPLATVARDLEALDAPPDPANRCRQAEGKAREAAFALDLMQTRGYFDTESPEYRQFVHDGIVDLVCHEVGHTLGLRHNFRASTIHTLEEIHDTRLTDAEGISASVMDYNPVNIAPVGETQGDYWSTHLGTYDYWAIEYAYTPVSGGAEREREALEKIAARGTDPKLPYATDEDALGTSPRGLDPRVNMWDFGPDPIEYYEQRLDLADEMLATMETTFEREGHRYPKMRAVFGRTMRQYSGAARTCSKYVGGMYQNRDHMGDDGGRLPLQPVPAADQRRAVQFLADRIFAADAFEVSPSLMTKLAPERFYDFDDNISYEPRLDYPVHAVVLGIQEAALDRLYHPIALNRMLDLPLYTTGDVYTMDEMFRDVRQAVWSELEDAETVSSIRRNLQRAHLRRLIALVVEPQSAPYFSPTSRSDPAGQIAPPQDAITFARADLVALRDAMAAVLINERVDAATRAHLDECAARVDAALTASVQRAW